MAPKMTDKRPASREPKKTKWQLEDEARRKEQQLKSLETLPNKMFANAEEMVIIKQRLAELAEDDLMRRVLADLNTVFEAGVKERKQLEADVAELRKQREQMHRDHESYKQGVRDASGTSDTRMFPPRRPGGFGW